MKWLLRLVAAGVIAFVLWQIWQRVFVTDETRIRHQITLMTRSVEKGNVLELSDAVAADYSDDWGMDKSTLIGAVRSFRMDYDALSVHLSDLTVTVDPDHQIGKAAFMAKVTARLKGSPTDKDIVTNHFALYFHKTDSSWKLTRVESPELKLE
jgi:hypothetical protein